MGDPALDWYGETKCTICGDIAECIAHPENADYNQQCLDCHSLADFESMQSEIYADVDERARHRMPAAIAVDDPAEEFAFCPGSDWYEHASAEEISRAQAIAASPNDDRFALGDVCFECGGSDDQHFGDCLAIN